MGFLDKIVKDVEKGVGRAQFEGDKLLKVNNLKSEVEKMKREQGTVLTQIGEQAVALQAAGQITLPGLETLIAQLGALRAGLAAKEAELGAAQKASFEGTAAVVETKVVGPAAAAAAPVVAEVATRMPEPQPAKVCPQCGLSVLEKAAFCPECGTKLG